MIDFSIVMSNTAGNSDQVKEKLFASAMWGTVILYMLILYKDWPL